MQQALSERERSNRAAAVNKQLLDSIREDKSLPALGSAVAQVVRLASSGDEAVGDLARFILSDVALTQKILRLANTVTCRGSSTMPVTTVSRAIFLLGFDMILSSATAMLLVDRLSDRQHASSVRKELGESLYASAVARALARRCPFKDAEEAAVAALFTNVGRVLVASHDHMAYREIELLQKTSKLTASQAALQVVGCSFEVLGMSVLREWQIPESTIAAALSPGFGRARPVKNRQDWMQQAVQFSAETAQIAATDADAQSEALPALLARFGNAFNIDEPQWREMVSKAAEETEALLMQMEPAPGEANTDAVSSERDRDAMVLPEMLLSPPDAKHLAVQARFPSGKPVNARDLLLAGVQDITQMMASGQCKASDLMLIVLETLCKSMGFRFAAVCLLDAQSGRFRARLAIGDDHDARRAGMAFAAASAHDLFHLSLDNDADLLIADASEKKIRNLLPAWHRELFADAQSFIVLPLVVRKKKVGFFYADRSHPAPEGVPADETSLIKTLKGQVLTALQAR